MPVILWIKRHLPESLLILILSFLCLQNFTPGTYLIGWDNLLPELNIWMNLKRSLFAVWQEYQGLGLVGGMGHATDLIRQLILLPFVLILPNNLIRYLWHFAMLFLGTFGIYFGLKKTLKFNPWIAFCSSLFYLLNFGSIQYFWVNFEPFSTFWGFFPWLIFSLWDYLENPKNLKKLLIINLLAIPSFYVQTIFIVYLICIFLIIFSKFIFSIKHWTLEIKHFSKILFLIFLINSFWLLPFFYFLKTSVQNPQLAQGNILATQETLDRNIRRGYLSDFLLLRGYYYDFPSSNGLLMAPWINHFSNQYVLISGYLISLIALFGLIYLLIKPKKFINLSLLLFLLLSCTALLTATPFFQQLNWLIRQFSLLDQVFRSPWTKFIVPTIFTFSLLLAYGLQTLITLASKLKYSTKIIRHFFIFGYLLLIINFVFPIFNGNYFSPHTRIKIPTEYFELFNYFKSQPKSSRIMNLPQGSFWGWTDYKWGLSGSGFIWYGIDQPITDRAFDVWQLKNENYYHQLSTALQQQNPYALKNILDNYSIGYVIFDNNVYFPGEKIYSKLSRPSKELLNSIPNLKLVKNFNQISIYQYTNTTPYLTTQNSLPIVTTSQKITTPSNILSIESLPDSHSPLLNTQSLINSTSDPYFHFQNILSSDLFAFNFSDTTFNHGNLLKITSRNINGHPILISAFDDQNHYLFFSDKLPPSSNWTDSWYFIPQMSNFDFDTGLTILFNNKSFNYFPSTNDIKNIKLYSVTDNSLLSSFTSPIKTTLDSKSLIFFYKINLKDLIKNSTLVLPQSYDSGWLAFSGGKLLPHVLVNNWANGWEVTNLNNQNIYIIFWPQLLEFLGFTLLISTFIHTLRK